MTSESVAQHMGKLSHRQLNIGALDSFFECTSTAGENCTHIPVLGMMDENLVLHFLANWYRSCLARLCAGELD